jgi:hypothetical protein
MRNLTWILQKNLTSELHRWLQALDDCGSSYREIDVIPFSDDLPDVSFATDYAICHGTNTMIKNCHKKGWNPGVFFTPDHFRPSLWQKIYGPHFLNHDGAMMKLGEISIPSFFGRGDLMAFVRPNGDFKDFTGSIVDNEGWERFVASVKEGGYSFDDQLEVFAAPLKEIVEEYRTFIVNGKVISASKYRLRTMLDKKPGAPQEVINFARIMAKIWSPEKAYVMDVARLQSGECKLLELNCFNASGVYAAPLEPIIYAVESLFPMSL